MRHSYHHLGAIFAFLCLVAFGSCSKNDSSDAWREQQMRPDASQTGNRKQSAEVPLPAPIVPVSLPLTENSRILSSVNLAKYYPKTTVQQRYRTGAGSLYSTYTYLYESNSFTGLYNQYWTLQKPGFLGTWSKHYAGSPHPATYAQIFFGNDGSVTEVGDYLNLGAQYNWEFVLFGYRSLSTYSIAGIPWALSGGAINISTVVHPYGQSRAGQPFVFSGNDTTKQAYTYVWAEELDSFQLDFGMKDGVWAKGNGKSYSNVLHLIFYHGTNQGGIAVNCSSKAGNYLKGWYSKVPGFASYVSEYYLAEGKWIIQERTLYIEDASYWRNLGQNISDCSGAAFDPSPDGSYGAYYLE